MRLRLIACLLLVLSAFIERAVPHPPINYAVRWKKIDGLLAKDQTAQAAPLVEAIYQQARQQNDAPAYVRALLYKLRLLQNKEEDADEKAIALLERDVKTATFPARPILHSLLGSLYTAYLNQNRYRLYQRTAGAAPTRDSAANADGGSSLATWDMGRIGAAIVRHYYLSVEDEPQRQLKTTLAELGDLAVGGDAEGRTLRPSLYDLLAHRAIEGLQNQELYLTRPEQQFTLSEPKLFGPAAEFAALRLLAPDADSLNGQLHALHLLQRLTASRLQLAPTNLAALGDVDLERLDYLHGITQSGELADQYGPALARMAASYAALPVSTEFMARRAELLRETDPVAAVALARETEAKFPKSRGAARARQLREEIERPELSFAAADIIVPGQPWRLDLTLRNVTEIHAWAYRISLKEWQQLENQDDDKRMKHQSRIARSAPAVSWAIPLPAHKLDYKEQKMAVAGSALSSGYYLILLSNKSKNPLLVAKGTVTTSAILGASRLSAVWRKNPDNATTNLLVLNRQSGKPIASVKAQARYSVYNNKKNLNEYRLGTRLITNQEGEVNLPAPELTSVGANSELLVDAQLRTDDDTLAVSIGNPYLYPMQQDKEVPKRHTFLFTDRAIYRPGQTLYFKGILTQNFREKASLLTAQPVSVRLQDVNGQTVQTLTFTTSDFGSFNGSLVLPTGLLNGEMSLQTDNGNVSFAVEDYKRPSFVVSFAPVTDTPSLGQPLTVYGQARAYAGQATDGATVSYRITRRELLPFYGNGYARRFIPGHAENTQEIAHGTTTTDAEGKFSLSFTPPLGPQAAGRHGWEPGYVFEITADVTDAAGETRSANRSLTIGHNPLNLQLTGPHEVNKQSPSDYVLLSTNATGEPLPATGTLRLLARHYRLNPPGIPGPVLESDDNEAEPELVKTLPFDTKNGPLLDLKTTLAALPAGRYHLEALVAGTDTVRAGLDFTLYDSQARTLPYATPDWFVALTDSVTPGQEATVLLGSGETGAHILLEVEREGQLIHRKWLTLAANEQRRLELASGPLTAIGPLYIHTTQVRDNHLYRHDATVQVAEKPQPLKVDISTFRDRLQPGQKETWRVTIHQADGQAANAELLATLYDQSLDVFRPHSFADLQFGKEYRQARFGWNGEFGALSSQAVLSNIISTRVLGPISYPVLNTQYAGELMLGEFIESLGAAARPEIYGTRALQGRIAGLRIMSSGVPGSSSKITIRGNSALAPPAPMAASSMDGFTHYNEEVITRNGASKSEPAIPNLSTVAARTDFRETAFWQPALRTDKNGEVVLEFQMPEAVTRWQLLALAHDQSLHSGQLARQLVTQKQIQISPNAPRFFRQGDTFTFAAKLSNLSEGAVSGTAQLFLLDAATGQDITSQLVKGNAQQAVSAAAKQSKALGWPISLPVDFAPVAITYRVVAQCQLAVGSEQVAVNSEQSTSKKSKRNHKQESSNQKPGTFTDGEENILPVLPNRVLITESLPLPIVGPATRTFELQKLSRTSSATRRNYGLTLEMTANPAWYAVQSLPYLMEYPYECSEQVFSRLYANLVAAQIIKANPRFRAVLAEWTRQAQNGTASQKNALASKLEQNQELKNLLLQETPWLRDAQGENERLARLSTLFDTVRLHDETHRALLKLQKMQLPGGAFPWFENMPDDRYITQLIVAGFGKLKKLGAFDATTDDIAREILQNALHHLDSSLARDYADLRQQKGVKLGEDHLGDLQIQALYARSFWVQPVSATAKPAYVYYQQQAASYWLGRTRYLQAQLALTLFRDNSKAPASQDILQALRENALHSPELGMYWKEVRAGYYWREAPTETQATLIEAFSEVKDDQPSVNEMKLWLLKQKQTQHWESTRATADACYALLLRGSDWLSPAQPLQITVGDQTVKPEAAQAGTGYFKTSWAAAEVKPAQGKVTITKPDAGVAWGALYWQYFEDIDKLTPATTPLSLERQLYRETRTAVGPQLEKLSAAAPLAVGDALVVRLVLRTDRALEYVQLKDQRAAGLEPIGQTSGYRYQNGLGYYESPRDAATNFFLGAVPRGTHVFEYRLRASQAGDFSGGLSEVQCLYAPEFGAHSDGIRVTIR